MRATIWKEFLILMRDPGGLLLLLLMPAALIVVMAFVQDAPFRDYQEMQFDVLVVNQDRGSVGDRMIAELDASQNFKVITELDGSRLNAGELKALLQKGTYSFGLVIPPRATAVVVSMSNQIANQVAAATGLPPALPTASGDTSVALELLFDPATKPAFRSSLQYALQQITGKVKMELLLERLSKAAGRQGDSLFLADRDILPVVEKSLSNDQLAQTSMNSVQHNVPAWAIFGMFLIVVPISGNMIRERDDGSAVRIRLIPDALTRAGIGKLIFHIMICMLQFFVMLLVGIFLLPALGLSRLIVGNHFFALSVVAFAIAAAAVAYGYLIGSLFKTANQAMPFGAISVVLLSAIGGVWVPVEILPPVMKQVALISPLHWGLEGVQQVMLRDGGIMDVLPQVLRLIGFALLLSWITLRFGRGRAT